MGHSDHYYDVTYHQTSLKILLILISLHETSANNIGSIVTSYLYILHTYMHT